MNKTQLKDVGSVVFWTDYVKSTYRRNDGEVTYSQSNTPVQDYCARTIGMCRRESGWIVSVAMSKDAPSQKTEKSGRGVVNHRIKALIDNKLTVEPEDKGITWVPYAWKELLINDKMAYSNIYGPLDSTSLKMAINLLNGTSNEDRGRSN